jgi:hypothetical protein
MRTIEELTDEVLTLPCEARALLADRLVESLDDDEEGYVHKLWITEAKKRRDEVRSGAVMTVSGEEGLLRVRKAVAQ